MNIYIRENLINRERRERIRDERRRDDNDYSISRAKRDSS